MSRVSCFFFAWLYTWSFRVWISGFGGLGLVEGRGVSGRLGAGGKGYDLGLEFSFRGHCRYLALTSACKRRALAATGKIKAFVL